MGENYPFYQGHTGETDVTDGSRNYQTVGLLDLQYISITISLDPFVSSIIPTGVSFFSSGGYLSDKHTSIHTNFCIYLLYYKQCSVGPS